MWGEMPQQIQQVRDVNELKQRLTVSGIVLSKASSMTQLMSGANVIVQV